MNKVSVLSVLLGLVLVVPAAAKVESVGGARVAVNKVTGKLNGNTKRLRAGDPVYENEVITTGAASRAEIQFRDKTLLTLGDKASVKLDRYVYNPRRKTGKIVINSVKGAFRFVTGSARKSSYQIKTRLATIGVRGTMIDGFMAHSRQFSVFLLQDGAMTVCTRRVCRNVDRVGYYVVVYANGTISKPKLWKGSIPGIHFTSRFPAPGGRFWAEPRRFYRHDHMEGEGGGNSNSNSPPSVSEEEEYDL